LEHYYENDIYKTIKNKYFIIMAKPSSSTLLGGFNFQLHQNVIVGTFVLGTVAFLLGHAWNAFFTSIIREQVYYSTGEEESGQTIKPNNQAILWNFVYAISATVFAVIIVFLMVRFEFLTDQSTDSTRGHRHVASPHVGVHLHSSSSK